MPSRQQRERQVFAYLRISRDKQEIRSQKHGLVAWGKSNGFTKIRFFSETVSRRVTWRKRALRELLDIAQPGDVLLVSEITRLGYSPVDVLTFLEAAIEKKVEVIITKMGVRMDGSLQSKILSAALSMASMIEVDFIRERTCEGLRRARAEGKRIGRPPGLSKNLKLDPVKKEIAEMVRLDFSNAAIARRFKVSRHTVASYKRRRFSEGVQESVS